MNTTGNSRPLAAWSVISVTASASPSYESWSATSAVSSSSRSSASSGVEVVVAGRDRAQLEQVRPALLAVLGAVGQHRPVARRLEDLVEQLGQRQHADPRPQPADERPRTRRARCASAARGPPARPARPPRSRPRSCRPRGPRPRAATSIVLSPMPARRDVDDPLEADAVGVRAQDPQVGERVLDLAPGVEPRAADELVAEAVAQERFLDRPGLGVHPVHDRDVAGAEPGVRVVLVGAPGQRASRGRRPGPRPGGRSTRPPPPRCRPRSAGSAGRPRSRSRASCPCARVLRETTAWAASRISWVER